MSVKVIYVVSLDTFPPHLPSLSDKNLFKNSSQSIFSLVQSIFAFYFLKKSIIVIEVTEEL